MNPETLLIMGALAGIGLCSAPDPDPAGGGGGGGGGPDPKPVEFSKEQQEKLNSIIAAERKSWETKMQPVVDKAKAVDDLQAQITKLQEEKELVGKTEAEKAKIAADQAAKRMAEDRVTAEKAREVEKSRADTAEKVLREERVSRALSAGLLAAKVFPDAIEDAIAAMSHEADIELDDKGKVSAIRFGGVTHKTVKEAAEAFLKTKPYFAAGVAGGAGTGRPGGGGNGAIDFNKASPRELIDAGWKKPVQGASRNDD